MQQQFPHLNTNQPPHSTGKEYKPFFALPNFTQYQQQDAFTQETNYSAFSSHIPQEMIEIFSQTSEVVSPTRMSPFKKPPQSVGAQHNQEFKFTSSIEPVKEEPQDKEQYEDFEHTDINKDLTCFENLQKIKNMLPNNYEGFCPLCKKQQKLNNVQPNLPNYIDSQVYETDGIDQNAEIQHRSIHNLEQRFTINGKQVPYLQSSHDIGQVDDSKQYQSLDQTPPPGFFQQQPNQNMPQYQFRQHGPNSPLLSTGKPPKQLKLNAPRFNSEHNLKLQPSNTQSPILTNNTNQMFYYGEEEKDSVNEHISPNKQKFSHFKDIQQGEIDSTHSLEQIDMMHSPGRIPSINVQQQSQNMHLSQQPSNFINSSEVLDNDIKEFKDIKGQLFVMSKTNSGSRNLQRFFHHCQQQEIDLVLEEIYEYLPDLVMDSYGNYMFQSLIQVSTVEQRQKILERIATKIPEIVLDKKGTHAMQTLVSMINIPYEIELIKKPILSKVQELSTLKALMTKYKGDLQKVGIFIKLIAQNSDLLIQSPYGNYAIQHAFETYGEEICQEILQKILTRLTQFSIQKFSSNVIEKCVSTYSKDFKHRAINEIIKSDTISEFMKNKYGNFIIHKLLMLGQDKKLVCQLLDLIKKNINNIHIQKFKTKWLQFLDKNTADPYLFAEGMNSPPGCSSPTSIGSNNFLGGQRKNSSNQQAKKLSNNSIAGIQPPFQQQQQNQMRQQQQQQYNDMLYQQQLYQQ